MDSIEREILQDIFTYFERFDEYGCRYRGKIMDIATEIIMRNIDKHLPELVDKIRKDHDDRIKKIN